MPHPGNPAYFKEADPSAWDVKDYAKSQLANGIAPRRIQDAWHLSLKEIRQCNKGCCTQAEIDQANVHYGRWNHGAKTDRKYLAQWLKAKEAKAEAQKYRGGQPSFSIGSVGSIFTAPVENAYNNAGEALRGSNPSINEVQEEPITPPPPASKEDSEFQQLLNSFKTTYSQMTQKTLLSYGKYLETEIYDGVMEQVTSGFKEPNQIFLWVIDLNDPITKCWFSDEISREIRDRVLPLPKVHPSVITSISGFVRCTTTPEFRNRAESTAYRSDPYNKEDHFDASWVHKAILHLVTLIEDSDNLLLSDELLEGTMECVLWAPLIDLLLLNVPLVIRRRDASLQAFRREPNKPHGNSPHFDAVISTRMRLRPSSTPDEWGIIEVSRKNDGPDSSKWKRDNMKILRGLCAMMRSVREYVGYDEDVLKELQFVGLVLAGLDVMTVRLTCVGNLFVKQEGTIRRIPTSIGRLAEAFELLESLWLFKKMMVDCQRVVQGFVEARERKGKKVAPMSPGTYCRERLDRSGAL